MLFLSIVQHYFLWHYSRALKDVFHVWLNLLWFILHFFSIPQLLRSWASPWKRITTERGEKWNFEDLAGYLLIGLISRLIGFVIRTVVIVAGLLATLVVVLLGFMTYLFWITAPISIIGILVAGLTLLFA